MVIIIFLKDEDNFWKLPLLPNSYKNIKEKLISDIDNLSIIIGTFYDTIEYYNMTSEEQLIYKLLKLCNIDNLDKEVEHKRTEQSFFVDKEETGSDGNTGMKSKFLEYFISDLADMDDVSPREAITKSKCLSADVNAAFDPTYSSNYDLNNSSYINRGVVLTKYTGSGGKYGTSDASAEYTGEICKLLSDNGVLWQSSELGIVDNGGGGTIAKYIANLNMDVIDVGVPVLSMHAPFEVISKIDLYMTYKAILTFFSNYDES